MIVDPGGKTLAFAPGTITRFTQDGAVDTSFGTGGVVQESITLFPSSVARQSDGKFVVTGNDSHFTATVVRYLPDGTRDPTFGVGGVATFSRMTPLAGYAIALQTDGKILLGGESDTNIGDMRFVGSFLARLLNDPAAAAAVPMLSWKALAFLAVALAALGSWACRRV